MVSDYYVEGGHHVVFEALLWRTEEYLGSASYRIV